MKISFQHYSEFSLNDPSMSTRKKLKTLFIWKNSFNEKLSLKEFITMKITEDPKILIEFWILIYKNEILQ